MTFREGDRDVGRVITGSSNLTYSGLEDNLDFNVELKNPSDYSLPKKDLKSYGLGLLLSVRNTFKQLMKKTWLNDTITP